MKDKLNNKDAVSRSPAMICSADAPGDDAERKTIDNRPTVFLGYSGHCADDDCGLYTTNEDNECPRCGAYFVFHKK